MVSRTSRFRDTLPLVGSFSLVMARIDSSPTTLEDSYPDCALDCIEKAYEKSSCLTLDFECICSDNAFQTTGSPCVEISCNTPDTLVMQNVTMTNCGIPRSSDRSQKLVHMSVPLVIVAGLFVVMRFTYKIFASLVLWIDDWLVLATFTISIPYATLNIIGLAENGLGRDMWTLPIEKISLVFKYFFITTVLYFIATTLVKLSIICFYLRIFPQQDTHLVLWATFGFTSLWGFIFFFITMFQCQPVSFFWTVIKTGWDQSQSDICLRSNYIALSHAIINIVLDLWIMAIPLWMLRQIKLHWKKKIGVGLMFSVGIIVTVMSILRLRPVVRFHLGGTKTWDFLDVFDVTLWSGIELMVAIICACLPAARLLLVRLFPRFGGSQTPTKDTKNSFNNHMPSQIRNPESS